MSKSNSTTIWNNMLHTHWKLKKMNKNKTKILINIYFKRNVSIHLDPKDIVSEKKY